jgi:hypothetical protein
VLSDIGATERFAGLDVVLRWEDSCIGWQGVAVARPARLMIVDDGTPGSDRYARALASATEAAIAGLTPTAVQDVPRCGCGRPVLGHLVEPEPSATYLLVWVTSDVAPASSAVLDRWVAQGWQVLCVLPYGAQHDTVIPIRARGGHAVSWRRDIAEVVPDVLSASGIVPDQNRMFITYRHADGRELAEELFHLLSEDRFAVFLDHFSLPPGIAFAEQIEQELLDKAFVVVAESPTINCSDWVKHEVAFAVKHRLGVAAVALPGATSVAGIDNSERVSLSVGEWLATPAVLPSGRASRIAAPAEDRIRRTIRNLHARTLVHRREILDASLRAALAQKGVPSSDVLAATGGLDVERSGRKYSLGLVVRPPHAEDLQAVHARASTQRSTPICVGAGPTSATRVSTLRWLVDTTHVSHRDEGDIEALADDIASGAI